MTGATSFAKATEFLWCGLTPLHFAPRRRHYGRL